MVDVVDLEEEEGEDRGEDLEGDQEVVLPRGAVEGIQGVAEVDPEEEGDEVAWVLVVLPRSS